MEDPRARAGQSTDRVGDRRPVVIFDFDDTLIESRSGRGTLLLAALDAFGTPASASIDSAWGHTFDELIRSLSPEAFDRFDEFIEFYASELRLHPPEPTPGAIDLVGSLASHARLFVHSASHSRLIRVDLDALGILSQFEFVCGSDYYTCPKAEPASLDPVRGLMPSWSNMSITYIGDSPDDFLLAERAGISFIGYASSGEALASLLAGGASPGAVVSKLAEVPRLLRSGAARDSEAAPRLGPTARTTA